ncbi:hypothetical protein VTK56DRAFT_6537 [Thermocarpiscus australiensis]
MPPSLTPLMRTRDRYPTLCQYSLRTFPSSCRSTSQVSHATAPRSAPRGRRSIRKLPSNGQSPSRCSCQKVKYWGTQVLSKGRFPKLPSAPHRPTLVPSSQRQWEVGSPLSPDSPHQRGRSADPPGSIRPAVHGDRRGSVACFILVDFQPKLDRWQRRQFKSTF